VLGKKSVGSMQASTPYRMDTCMEQQAYETFKGIETRNAIDLP